MNDSNKPQAHKAVEQAEAQAGTRAKTGSVYSRRRIVGLASLGAIPLAWHTPVVRTLILPAHAQTTEVVETCDTNYHVGGPLIGNRFGATSCQDACQASADFVGGELCAVTETDTPSGVDCGCDIEIP